MYKSNVGKGLPTSGPRIDDSGLPKALFPQEAGVAGAARTPVGSGVVAGAREREVEAEARSPAGRSAPWSSRAAARGPGTAPPRRPPSSRGSPSARRPRETRAGNRGSRSSRARWRRGRCRARRAPRPRRGRARGRACCARGRTSRGSPPRRARCGGLPATGSVNADADGAATSSRATRWERRSVAPRELSRAVELDRVPLPVVEGERVDVEPLAPGDQQAGRGVEPAGEKKDATLGHRLPSRHIAPEDLVELQAEADRASAVPHPAGEVRRRKRIPDGRERHDVAAVEVAPRDERQRPVEIGAVREHELELVPRPERSRFSGRFAACIPLPGALTSTILMTRGSTRVDRERGRRSRAGRCAPPRAGAP